MHCHVTQKCGRCDPCNAKSIVAWAAWLVKPLKLNQPDSGRSAEKIKTCRCPRQFCKSNLEILQKHGWICNNAQSIRSTSYNKSLFLRTAAELEGRDESTFLACGQPPPLQTTPFAPDRQHWHWQILIASLSFCCCYGFCRLLLSLLFFFFFHFFLLTAHALLFGQSILLNIAIIAFDLAQICVEPLFLSGSFVQVELVDIPVRRSTPAIPFAVDTRRTRWSPLMQDWQRFRRPWRQWDGVGSPETLKTCRSSLCMFYHLYSFVSSWLS